MTGWGQRPGPAPEVQAARDAGDLLAAVVAAFVARPTTGNQERLTEGLATYRSTR